MSQKKPHEMKTTRWCITYWLTDTRTLDDLDTCIQQMPTDWHLEGQIEQGVDSQQKLHAQLFLKTPQTRGTKIAKIFKNCYIDEARNPFALQNYVHKTDTRVAELKTVENRSPQWHVVVDAFADWLVREEFHIHASSFGPPDQDERLRLWDQFILQSLMEDMRVDVIGVNPQYRSCIAKYWKAYIHLALRRQVDRQTNRQTNSFQEEVVSVPTIENHLHRPST